jgi:hypothetical protein
MTSKPLLIAIAAMAVTTTNVNAHHSTEALKQAGLSSEQIEALAEAHELRQAGDWQAARDTLVEAGIDESVLQSLKTIRQDWRQDDHEKLRTIMGTGDFEQFKEYASERPIGDIITTPEEFELLREAHTLRQTGNRAEAKHILRELGFERKPFVRNGIALAELTEAEEEALRVARQANDKATVRAILRGAGIE